MSKVAAPRRSFCSDGCSRAFARQEQRAAGRWARWLAKSRRAKQQIRLSEHRWRKVAMDREAEAQIALIFQEKGKRK